MIALVDQRIDAECRRALLERKVEIINLPPCDLLDAPVASHPDMLVFVGKGQLVCHEAYYNKARSEIDRAVLLSGLTLTVTDEEWGGKYPNDVLFNAAPVGDKLICNKKSVSRVILELYGEENVINVRQGYAKCSTVTVADGGIVTADRSIARAARDAGLDVLELSGQHTDLYGYDGGFIGGASGDDGKSIIFTGNISLHPECESIVRFCQKHGREVVSLSKKTLYDYGTLIFV